MQFLFVFTLLMFSYAEARGVNGGWGCAVCTVLFGVTDQLAEIHNETLLNASVRLCDMVPYPVGLYCKYTVEKLEPILINDQLTKLFTPDVLCYGLGFCYLEPSTGFCHLFPRPKTNFYKTVEQSKKHLSSVHEQMSTIKYDICQLPGIHEICELLAEGWTKMAPAIDVDGDMFSLVESARGSHWRGRDCQDWNAASYPGRQPLDGDKYSDANCNGIWGQDHETGRTWEDILCRESGSQGLIVLGDSVSAHFHLPEVWLNPMLMSPDGFHNFTAPLFDELDWPHLGTMTGYMNSTDPILIKGITDSLYWRLRARNRCNHRDYQNLSRNGASSHDILHYVENIARNQKTDKAALVLYAALGNDVCNSFGKTVENMTTPQELKKNVLQILKSLDSFLPNGSHVLLVGLINGSFIYPTMADRLHPIGKLRGDVHYRDVYQWFTCMEIGPCLGWMTPNATLRQIASQRARELNVVLKNIALSKKFTNFDVHYLKCPLEDVLDQWKKQGKPLWKLIDPVDSLHPDQEAQSLIAEAMWTEITQKFPHVLGPENPNNAKIVELFGEQGGH